MLCWQRDRLAECFNSASGRLLWAAERVNSQAHQLINLTTRQLVNSSTKYD